MMRSCVGTPQTMEPKILRKQMYSNKADLYSVGIIFFNMVTGTFPFYAGSFEELYSVQVKGKYKFPKQVKISKVLANLIHGLM